MEGGAEYTLGPNKISSKGKLYFILQFIEGNIVSCINANADQSKLLIIKRFLPKFSCGVPA